MGESIEDRLRKIFDDIDEIKSNLATVVDKLEVVSGKAKGFDAVNAKLDQVVDELNDINLRIGE